MYTYHNSVYGDSDYSGNLNIKDSFNHLILDLKEYFNSLFDKFDNKYVSLIKNGLNKIANLLDSMPELSREFLDFLKIENMLTYALDNKKSIKNNDLKSIFNLIPLFGSLLSYKLNSIIYGDSKEYVIKYDEFKLKFNEVNSFFNENIYVLCDDFDEDMIEVSKILLK